MMQQYREAKERHPGMLLLFRMGDFYELFETDAETAHKVLGLTLTSRDKEMPMAGFPHHQLESYLHKLLHQGLPGVPRHLYRPLPPITAFYRPLYITRQILPAASSVMYSEPSGPTATPTGRCLGPAESCFQKPSANVS